MNTNESKYYQNHANHIFNSDGSSLFFCGKRKEKGTIEGNVEGINDINQRQIIIINDQIMRVTL